ncbi:MAG: SGNH hydrolase domain-containing protein [Nocardioides sp.]
MRARTTSTVASTATTPRQIVAALLLSLSVVLSLAAAVPAQADDTTFPASRLERGDPPPSGDFPRMPSRCYEPDNRTLKDAPCAITRYGAARPKLVVWGDSHAWMYLPALEREARRQRVNLTLVVFGSCPPSLPLPRSRGFGRVQCEKHNTATLGYIRRQDRKRDDVSLLIGGFWSGYRQAYALQQRADRNGTDSGLTPYQQQMSILAVESSPKLFTRLGQLRLDIDLIGQAATVPTDPAFCLAGRDPYQCDLPRNLALDDEVGNRRWINRNLRAQLVGRPRLIDTTPAYCNASTCFGRVDGVNTFYDDIHLGAALTSTLTGYFAPVFNDVT